MLINIDKLGARVEYYLLAIVSIFSVLDITIIDDYK